MSKSSLEGIETPKLYLRQAFKELESRKQALNEEIARVLIWGWGVPPPPPPPLLSGRAWGDTGGSDKDYLNSWSNYAKAYLRTKAEKSLHTPEPASQVGGFSSIFEPFGAAQNKGPGAFLSSQLSRRFLRDRYEVHCTL